MKIVQVIPSFGMGGAETMCENLVYELKKAGHEVIVLSLYDEQTAITRRIEDAGIDLRYLHKKGGPDFSMYGKLREVFRGENPDVVHTHLGAAKYVFPVASRLKIKVVHTVHNVAAKEAPKSARIFNRFFFRRRKAIPVALSEKVRQTILQEYKMSEKDVPIVLNGIDIGKCIPKNDYSESGNFRILHIGRFFAQKNHEGLLQAFRQFHDKCCDSELYLIGDGEKREEAEAYVKDNRMESCVHFLGLQGNVYKYLHETDIFALPSLYEGIPMTIIEAMGTGLPIVATAVGGVPDMLSDDCALLVPVEADAIAAAFEKYYSDANLRESHGRAALRRADAFSASAMAQKYIAIYEEVRQQC